MRAWLVAGAVIEGPAGLLLVQNRRRDGRTDWSTPGGVVDDHEELLDGLHREVNEETGLVVTGWHPEPLYRIDAVAPDLDWHLRVEVHRATGADGDIVLEDPDGIVVDARWVAESDCADHLARSPRWVREPLQAWLDERWTGDRTFRYRILGTELGSLRVETVDED
jgi:8-oxo-dGTP diphosphatase